MIRLLVALALLAATAHAAAAQGLTIFPVGRSNKELTTALEKANVGAIATTAIDATCASDPGCLINEGTKVNASRVLAITVLGGGKLTLMLVDVGGKTVVGTRDITIKKGKLAKELGPTITRTVDELSTDKAKALFAEGNQHFNVGEFQQALDKYKLAYKVKPLPAFQFNIAQCHRKLGQYKEAIAMYQAYLQDVPSAQNKAVVASLIKESKKAVADQEALERERLATESKKAEEARKAKEAEAGAVAERARAESEKQKTEQARIEAERERDKTYNRHPARKWMLVTGGLGLAVAGVGGYFGLRAMDSDKKFKAECSRDMLLLPDEISTCNGYIKAGDRDAKLSNVLLASGGAVVLASLIVFIIDPGNVERPKSVAITPRSVELIVRW